MGDRRTEQREDPVSCRLRDVAVVAVDRIHHDLQRGIDDRLRRFGV